MPSRKIRVLIVDDSAVVRKVVTDALAVDPEIEVVGTAMNPYLARDKIVSLQPDVLTLDIEMPRMDGLTFLRIIMAERPMPVIVLSSLTQAGSHHAFEALRLGAVDVLGKPGAAYTVRELGPQLREKIKAASIARVRAIPADDSFLPTAPETSSQSARIATRGAIPTVSSLRELAPHREHHARRVILLGASTGGTEALREILTRLPGDLPPIAIVQHIPAVFSQALAQRLDAQCQLEVREAVDGDRLVPGLALIAPGNFHMLVHWAGDGYRARVVPGPPVWHQRPAVDMLFKSAIESGGHHAIAGVLTGMGKDGAEGLLKLRNQGALTFSQDEASSVVYGMPRAAWELGGSQKRVSLDQTAQHLVTLADTKPTTASIPASQPILPQTLTAHVNG